jgi:hypothetical protein
MRERRVSAGWEIWRRQEATECQLSNERMDKSKRTSRESRRGKTGHKTGRQVVDGLGGAGELSGLLAGQVADLLEGDLVDGELGHGVRDLLEKNGTETGVETTETLLSRDSSESTGETVGEGGLGDESDSDGLEGAEGDVGEELSDGGGSEVDGLSVLSGSLDTVVVDGLLLPELVCTERMDEGSGIEPLRRAKEGKSNVHPPNLKAPWIE